MDIQALLERGLLSRTEVGGIAEKDLDKIVAVERDPESVVILQRRLPGLRIIERAVEDFLRSGSLFAWPTGEDRDTCRAIVVNFDFQQALLGKFEHNQTNFPVIRLIEKIALLHALPPHVDWTLCLTLNGSIDWSAPICLSVQRLLAENFAADEVFALACGRLLGENLTKAILAPNQLDFSQLPDQDQQRVLMAFVPKQISRSVLAQGWKVETERNLMYGGSQTHAPMVSWICHFKWDTRATSQPAALYAESLSLILSGAAKIEDDGTIS